MPRFLLYFFVWGDLVLNIVARTEGQKQEDGMSEIGMYDVKSTQNQIKIKKKPLPTPTTKARRIKRPTNKNTKIKRTENNNSSNQITKRASKVA